MTCDNYITMINSFVKPCQVFHKHTSNIDLISLK